MPGDITGEELKALYDPDGNGDYADCFKMVVHGHAIQAAGFTENEETGETAEDMAWKAFEAQNTVNS